MGVQMWFLAPLETAACPCARRVRVASCVTLPPPPRTQLCLRGRRRPRVVRASLSRRRWFCSIIAVDKEAVTLLLRLVKFGGFASLPTMTLHG